MHYRLNLSNLLFASLSIRTNSSDAKLLLSVLYLKCCTIQFSRDRASHVHCLLDSKEGSQLVDGGELAEVFSKQFDNKPSTSEAFVQFIKVVVPFQLHEKTRKFSPRLVKVQIRSVGTNIEETN